MIERFQETVDRAKELIEQEREHQEAWPCAHCKTKDCVVHGVFNKGTCPAYQRWVSE